MDIGSFGASEGEGVTVDYTVGDWLRSSFLWILLFALLLRKPNHTKKAWLIWIPLLAAYLTLCGVEKWLLTHLIFYKMQYAASSMCELLRLFAIGLAILLTTSDLLRKVKSRFLCSLLSFLILFTTGSMGTRLNGWPMLNSRTWTLLFLVFLMFFFVSHRILTAACRKISHKRNFPMWYPTFCLILGTCPAIVISSIMIIQHAFSDFYNPSWTIMFSIMLCLAVSLPYLILGIFAIGSLGNTFYRQRFSHCFISNQPVNSSTESEENRDLQK